MMKLCFLVFCCVVCCSGAVLKETQDASASESQFINSTNFKEPDVSYDNSPLNNATGTPSWKPDWKVQLPFAGAQCTNNNGKWTCCANIRVQAFGFDREACASMNYMPFMPSNSVNMNVAVNNATVFRKSFSPRGTKEYCVPFPSFFPNGPMDFCVRLYDLTVVERKLHVCMKMLTRIAERPVMTLRFNCMDIDGVDTPSPDNAAEAHAPEKISEDQSSVDNHIAENAANRA